MILRFLLLLLCTALFSCIPRHGTFKSEKISPEALPFNSDEFNRRFRLAEELAQDDFVAWQTSDSITAHEPHLLDSLDQTWFVCRIDGKRYAYYGRYISDEHIYTPKYVFAAENNNLFTLLPLFVNDQVRDYARTVYTGCEFFRALLDSMEFDVSYNHYIRDTENGTFKMWFFPAGYGNYCAHGLDIFLEIDSTGTNITNHSLSGTFIRYFELDKDSSDIELDNTYDPIPTVGNLFFALMNRKHFSSIKILNKHSVSTVRLDDTKGTWEWFHSAKQKPVIREDQ